MIGKVEWEEFRGVKDGGTICFPVYPLFPNVYRPIGTWLVPLCDERENTLTCLKVRST